MSLTRDVKDLEMHFLETTSSWEPRGRTQQPPRHTLQFEGLCWELSAEIILGVQEGFENKRNGLDGMLFLPHHHPVYAFVLFSFK